MKVESLLFNKENLELILKKIDNNYDCYFLNEVKFLEKVLNNSIYIVNGNNYKILKIQDIFLKFLDIEFTDIDEYTNNLGRFAINYMYKNLVIIDQLNKPEVINNLIIKKFNDRIIDELYENKLYDQCCFLINFVIKHRLSKNASYIYKTFSLLDKINYHIRPNEIAPLLKLLNFNNIDEIFNVCIVLKYHGITFIASEEIKNFFLKIEVKNLNDGEIIKLLYIIYLFDFLIKEINIYDDNIFLKFLIKYLDKISLNYQTIKEIDSEANDKDIYASVLLYLHSRFDLIDSEIVKKN